MDLRHKERHIKMTSSGTPRRAHPPKADIGNRKINGAQTPLTFHPADADGDLGAGL